MRISDTATETDWLVATMDALATLGWRAYHARPGRRRDGWATMIQGVGSRGFPDVCAVRGGRVLWLELKTETGRISRDQREWNRDLTAAGQECYFIVLPRDWEMLMGLLAREPEQLEMSGQETLSLTSNSTGASWLPLSETMKGSP